MPIGYRIIMVRIAFYGKLCSGKTTAANMVLDILPNSTKLSFAQKLKEIAVDLFNMDGKDRALLQDLGKKMREIDPDVWVNYLVKQFDNHDHIVIDDLRFTNEYSKLRENGFIIVKLIIPKHIQINRIKDTYPSNWKGHIERLEDISETESNSFIPDFCFDSSNLGDLAKNIANLLDYSFV